MFIVAAAHGEVAAAAQLLSRQTDERARSFIDKSGFRRFLRKALVALWLVIALAGILDLIFTEDADRRTHRSRALPGVALAALVIVGAVLWATRSSAKANDRSDAV